MREILRQLLFVLFLALCFCGMTPRVGISSAIQEPESYSETLYIRSFIDFRLEQLWPVKNMVLGFKNVETGPPVDISSPAFGDGFVGVSCELVRYGRQCFLSFRVTYSNTTLQAEAVAYARIIIQEFMKTFNYTGLDNIYSSESFVDANIEIIRQYGWMKYDADTFSSFLRYKPVNGCFCRFIDGLVNKYVADDPNVGLDPTYTLKKNADGTFSWDFSVFTSIMRSLPRNTKEYTVDLKELMNTNESIINEPCRQAAIFIYVGNGTQIVGDNKYAVVNFRGVEPEGTITPCEDSGLFDLRIAYDCLKPIENIRVSLSAEVLDVNSDMNLKILIGLVVGTIVALFLILFFILKKRKNR